MRARGLKPVNYTECGLTSDVAPHAGAWIETLFVRNAEGKTMVAPHAGAWIETKQVN